MEENELLFLTEAEGITFLESYNIPIPESRLVNSLEEAKAAFGELQKPLVLKGMSPQITHKSDAGIVKLGISSLSELEYEYLDIADKIHAVEDAIFKGILVQEMAPKGTEIIIGIKKDSVFGHQLLIGAGGIFVEVFKDVQIGQMPVTDNELKAMVERLKVYPILNGYRGGNKINFEKLSQIVQVLNKVVDKHPEIEEIDFNPVIFYENEARICDVRIAISPVKVSRKTTGKTRKSTKYLDKMFNPKSIAVVGATNDEKKNGGRLIRYIIENGFDGEIYPVNPKNATIRGYKCYPTVREIPYEVDLACVIVASKFVPGIIKDCAEKGIKNAIIYSSGFAEIGEVGQKLQDEIAKISEEHGIRVIGPNTIGMVSSPKNIYTAFGMVLEAKDKYSGNIGFVSQSGALGSSLLSRAWEKGIGFSRWISVGNAVDLSIPDFIDYLATDEVTKVISCFMESLSDAQSFKEATQMALKNKKPVLVYKTGRTDEGKRAVQSHTGSIAGNDLAYDAAFNKLGVLRLNNIQDTIDVASAFSVQPLPKGKNIGIITASGGACSIVADLCNRYGLKVPLLKESEKIMEHIPSFGSAQNPIDVTAEIMAKPEMFKEVLKITLEDENVDALAIMFTTNADPGASILGREILDVLKDSKKPIVVGRLGSSTIAPRAVEMYKKSQFPIYDTPEKLVRVLHYLVKYGELINNIEVENEMVLKN
jgi:acetate---CoA ligase (ADP-forming)